MPKKLEKFVVEEGGQKVHLALLQVDAEIGMKASQAYNRAFSLAVKSDALLRAALQNVMTEQNIWNDAKENLYNDLVKKITENQEKIARGGIKLSQAKDLALEIRVARSEVRDLIAERSQMDVNSAEGQADNARFNAMVALCTINDETGDLYFKDMDDYLSRSSETAAVEAATKLGQSLYGLDSKYEHNLPENKFLTKWSFIDEELRLINKDGHLVDSEGRLINDEGRYIDVDGEFVDVDGKLITEEGEPVVESQPFLDDEGCELVDPDAKEEEDEDEEVEVKKEIAEVSA